MSFQKSLEFENNSAPREVFNYNDIAVEAKAIIEQANLKANGIVAQSKLDAKVACKAGHAKGFEEGFKEGVEKGTLEGAETALVEKREVFSQNSTDLVEMFKSVLTSFGSIKENLEYEAQQNTLILSVAIAKKIMNELAADSDDVIKENLDKAIKLMAIKTNIKIILNPEDMDKVRVLVKEPDSIFTKIEGITFVGDDRISRGGCQIINELCEVDAQIETQIERIAKQVVIIKQ